MADIKIVIGANFGDEGKGFATDYFALEAKKQNKSTIVVCHNGGAQRGHTVKLEDGTRHVFHHFGSGTFRGAATYLSEDFILNPMVFVNEWAELETLGYTPKVFVNRNCRFSTPFDMMINQIIEENRGDNKHGSCGLGIFETIERCKNSYAAPVGKIKDKYDLYKLLKLVRDSHLPKRLGNYTITKSWGQTIDSMFLIDNYMNDFFFMKNHVTLVEDNAAALNRYDTIIFEGAQGLMLDQNNTDYAPHLTPSNTGLTNPKSIIESLHNDNTIEVCYVTRTYLTRHGAGRLDNECKKEDINKDMIDRTNVPNPHQGTMRYAPLNVRDLYTRICIDFGLYNATRSLMITHGNELSIDLSLFKHYFRDDIIYVQNKEENR